MTIEVAEPTVYLVAHTGLTMHEEIEYEDGEGNILTIKDFLEAEGCNEESDICVRADVYGERADQDDTDLDFLPEFAGRACYGSYGRKQDLNSRYIGHIINVGHGSVLEHSVVTLAYTGVSRTFTHEHVRHRLYGYSQRSQRFVDESSFAIAMPPLYKGEGWEEAYAKVIEASEKALDYYKELAELGFAKLSTPEMLVRFAIREGFLTNRFIDNNGRGLSGKISVGGPEVYIVGASDVRAIPNNEPKSAEEWTEALANQELKSQFEKATNTARRKTARESARSVLPNCTETKIFATGNLRAWRGMLDQRASIHADREIRGIAMQVLRIMKTIAPNVFADYVIKTDAFDMEYAETPNRKV